jgi:Tfp pilus assembly protein PilZ
MKKRPLLIQIIVILALLFPFLMISQYLVLRNVSLREAIGRFLWAPAPVLAPWEYVAATGVAYLLAWAVWQVKRWSWWIALGVGVALVAHNVFVITNRVASPSHLYLWIFAFITVVPAGVATLLLMREVRAPFFNPRIRWWEQDPRYPINVPLEGGGRVLDISRTGVFAELAPLPDQGARARYAFTLEGARLEAEAEVIWVSTGDSTHPGGVGLRFVGLDGAQQASLGAMVERQRQLGRKAWQRRETRYPTDIRCGEEDQVLDLSLGGLFVESDAPRRVGETVELRLRRGDHDLTVSGEVVWASDGEGGRPRGFGVRFGRLAEPVRAGLGRLVAELQQGR